MRLKCHGGRGLQGTLRAPDSTGRYAICMYTVEHQCFHVTSFRSSTFV